MPFYFIFIIQALFLIPDNAIVYIFCIRDIIFKYIFLYSNYFLEIEEGYFEYGNFEFKNGNFEKQSGELKTKLELKANLT